MRRRIAILLVLSIAAALATGCGPLAEDPGDSGLHSAVPDVVGMQQEDARSAIEKAGYVIGSLTATNAPEADAGTVVEQQPLEGTSAPRKSAVDIVISSP